MGHRRNPFKTKPMRMVATQILAYPKGFVWDVEARRDHIWISGADRALDDQSFSRFWLFGFLPVVRAGGQRITPAPLSAAATQVHSMESSHSPFYSQPGKLAKLIDSIV